MTALHEVLPNADDSTDLSSTDLSTVSIDNVLGRWEARRPALGAESSGAASFRDDLLDADLLLVVTQLVASGREAEVLALVRRIAAVSPDLGRSVADQVHAVAHVREHGSTDELDGLQSAASKGLATGWARRTTQAAPGPGDGTRLAPFALRDGLELAGFVAPVDLVDGGRATALVPAGEVERTAVLAPEHLLAGTSTVSHRIEALAHAAVSLGTADRLLHAAAAHARSEGAPWSGRTYDRLIDDPYVILRFGRLRAELNASDRLLADTLAGPRADAPAAATIAKAAAASILTAVATELPDLVGAAGAAHDGLWEAVRAARLHTLSESLAWNEALIGQELLAQRATTTSVADEPSGTGVPVLADPSAAIAAAHAIAGLLARDAVARDRDRRHPAAELQALGRTGLLGITAPTELGGPQLGTATVAEVVRIIGTADGSVAQILQPHFGALELIRLSGTPAQQAYFFAEALAGARFGNANAELGTKSAGDIRTRLLNAPDGGFTVDGIKSYTTGSFSADWIPVSVRDPAGNRASALVRREAEGVDVVDDWSGLGQRTTVSGTTTLKGVRVFEQHVIAQWRAGEGSHLSGAKSNIVHGAVNVGIAGGALAAAHDYIVTKARPSKDLGIESVVEDPHVVRRYGRLAVRLAVAESALARAADLVDIAQEVATPQSISAATVAAAETEALGSEFGLEISSELFALAGASSSRSELGLDRFWRDVRTHSLHDTMIWKYHQSGDSLLSGAFYFGNRRTVF